MLVYIGYTIYCVCNLLLFFYCVKPFCIFDASNWTLSYMKLNQFSKTLLILLATASILLVYPFIHEKVPFLKQHFRTYDFWGKFYNSYPKEKIVTPPEDTLAVEEPQETRGYNGLSTLTNFFRALQSRDGQIRIAYYGDSSIEGDLISQTLRDSLQRRFGGKGVGFVPITTHVSGFRRSVRHRFSPNWYTCKVTTNNYRKLPRGISGEYYTIWHYTPKPDTLSADSTLVDTMPPPAVYTGGHWVSYGTTRLNPGTSTFSNARLFYGTIKTDSQTVFKPANLTVTIGKEEQTISLDGRDAVNEVWLTQSAANRIRLDFSASSALPVFGASLESPQGVIVDNFSARGNSGILLANITPAVLEQFQSKLDYELVILQFGLNVLNAEMEDYSWYEKEMTRLIKYYQAHLPGADILVVGVSDKATRIDAKMMTDPSVPRITQAQRQAAQNAGVAFFSLYEAMGGEGAMIKWVEEETPRLANLDYAHFNFEGADKAAQMLLDFLMDGYAQYLKKDTLGQLIQ